MNRPTIVSGTVALCAAGCLFLNAAMAQDQDRMNPGQDRSQQQRMTAGQNQGIEALKALEGQWRVTVEFMSGAGERPGSQPRSTTPQNPPGQGGGTSQQIQQTLEREFQTAGLTATEAREAAQELASQVTSQSTQAQIEQRVKQVLTDNGIEEPKATQEAARIAQRVYQQAQTPAQPGQPARPAQPAQPAGAQPSAGDKFEGMATRRWVLDGVALHEDLRISSGPGASPARFREEGTGGQQQASQSVHLQQVKAIIAQTLQQENTVTATQAEMEAEKIANKLASSDATSLEEELKTCLVDANISDEKASQIATRLAPQIRPHLEAMKRDGGQADPARPGQPTYRPASGEQPDFSNFQGMGIFSYDQEEQTYSHVWIDNHKGCAKLHTGDYDAASKTFTFRAEGDGSAAEEFTLKITDPNTHVIEMRAQEGGQTMSYRVTYTKAGATPGQQPGIRERGTGTGGEQRDETPDRPGTPRTVSTDKVQQLDTLITQHLQRLGLENDVVIKHSRELREDVVEDYQEGDIANIEAKIADALNDAGVESERAKTEATRLAASIRALLGN